MDKPQLAEKLGLPPGGVFQITDMQWVGWGSDMIFECLYEVEGDNIPFQMILKDCREQHWRVYAHVEAGENGKRPAAALVNLRLGSDQHRKALNMLTDFFGLTIFYGELTIFKR